MHIPRARGVHPTDSHVATLPTSPPFPLFPTLPFLTLPLEVGPLIAASEYGGAL